MAMAELSEFELIAMAKEAKGEGTIQQFQREVSDILIFYDEVEGDPRNITLGEYLPKWSLDGGISGQANRQITTGLIAAAAFSPFIFGGAIAVATKSILAIGEKDKVEYDLGVFLQEQVSNIEHVLEGLQRSHPPLSVQCVEAISEACKDWAKNEKDDLHIFINKIDAKYNKSSLLVHIFLKSHFLAGA